ncbi:hypothetical protein BDZ91DRAFT_255172 [Kalaharituber pfeilii]|nr:hypothetical protein BDZ91DRAFT_255172 [Kalaharituber pfeilii]
MASQLLPTSSETPRSHRPPPRPRKTAYPALTRTASSAINNVRTDAMSVWLADKIIVTVSQNGRLAQWFHVPLNVSQPSNPLRPHTTVVIPDDLDNGEDTQAMLPLSHLTPTTLLGGGCSEREAVGQLYAAQLASAIRMRDVDETRTVVLGLGLEKGSWGESGMGGIERNVFFEVMELLGKVL